MYSDRENVISASLKGLSQHTACAVFASNAHPCKEIDFKAKFLSNSTPMKEERM